MECMEPETLIFGRRFSSATQQCSGSMLIFQGIITHPGLFFLQKHGFCFAEATVLQPRQRGT